MITKRHVSILALAALSLGSAAVRADEYQDAINIFRKAEESGRFFGKAYGYAVFPTIGKGGIGVGGAYGTGHVYEKGKHIGDVSMTQRSSGFQLAGQGIGQIIFFENAAALKTFTSHGFEFGAEASAVTITAGASAKAGSGGAAAGASVDEDKSKVTGAYNNGVVTFTVVKGGLMYEASDCWTEVQVHGQVSAQRPAL